VDLDRRRATEWPDDVRAAFVAAPVGAPPERLALRR
jgi:hypothetical protein